MGIQWQAWGTAVRLEVTDAVALPAARRIVGQALARAERAADCDRPGAEMHRLLRSGGRPLGVRPMLSALVATALDVAEQTGGLVDPTVGSATIALRRALGRATPSRGLFPVCSAFPALLPRPAVGWGAVEWSERAVALPVGAALDLSATAKARTARLAATRVADRLGVGALVEIGGDVATAGPAPGRGWLVSPRYAGPGPLELAAGTALAACRAAGVVDPATGRQVTSPWEAVVVVGADVVAAKAAAVAALAQGPGAVAYLDTHPAVIMHSATWRPATDGVRAGP